MRYPVLVRACRRRAARARGIVDFDRARPRTRAHAIMSTDPDPWLGVDKLLHCVGCGAITCCTYCAVGLLRALRGRRRTRLALGCTAGTAAGVAKEIGDSVQAWPFCPCGASPRDLAADVLGVMIGVLLILIVHMWCDRCGRISTSSAGRSTQSADELDGHSAA